jgi:glyoxylase-like metal-dependent hydrolase (beta-lactamase superfamily II)
VGHAIRNGVARAAPVAVASSFSDEEVLEVPGHPRVIHAPGHTAGNVAISLEDREVLIVGDTLATIDLAPGESGLACARVSSTTITSGRWRRCRRSSRSRLAGCCPVTVFLGREVRSSGQAGQADRSPHKLNDPPVDPARTLDP